MKHIAALPPRLYCATCDDTYDLPPKTHVKLYKEFKCPLDDFEMLMCSTGQTSLVFYFVIALGRASVKDVYGHATHRRDWSALLSPRRPCGQTGKIARVFHPKAPYVEACMHLMTTLTSEDLRDWRRILLACRSRLTGCTSIHLLLDRSLVQ